MIKNTLLYLLLTFPSLTFASSLNESDVYWVQVGETAPDFLTTGYSTNSPFLLITVPVKDPTLKEEIPNLNVFLFPESKVVSGLRGNHSHESRADCLKSKERVSTVLSSIFPVKYSGIDSRYQFQSNSGQTIAGVVCSKARPFSRLTVEITNPTLEQEMMQSWKLRD